ncbi:hypothetical protein UMM65_04870 [Aureibaculum sp. 2210JD6-5]|uniref:hypothetical protein n=1 Tax=Aureibaculum sp. 2210JD6-5 TaxID=3103957 RepID=UPI002AADE051|nr:hypothetical protein [Aureibaculum sp. 2210JD6-5]MDY7394562.1 hypothetical protein [Aureibaculum sp. 2210JD6-5]
MKLTKEQLDACAYIFEKANGNETSQYEEKTIAESGLKNLNPCELKIQIINGLNDGLYLDSKERISAYWALSKVHDKNLIPNFRIWLKIELEKQDSVAIYQLMIALGNLEEAVFNKNRKGSAFNETELNLRDAENYLKKI